MKRVVVTGMSGITSLGETADAIFEKAKLSESIRFSKFFDKILDFSLILAYGHTKVLI